MGLLAENIQITPTIRPATREDIAEMATLWMAMMREVYPERNPNPHWWIEDCIYEMDGGIYSAFIAEANGKIVGFTDAIFYKDASYGCLVGWSNHSYVFPEYRHGSLTSGLYKAMYEEGRSRGASLALFACTDDLAEFWKKHGYTKSENIMMGVV